MFFFQRRLFFSAASPRLDDDPGGVRALCSPREREGAGAGARARARARARACARARAGARGLGSGAWGLGSAAGEALARPRLLRLPASPPRRGEGGGCCRSGGPHRRRRSGRRFGLRAKEQSLGLRRGTAPTEGKTGGREQCVRVLHLMGPAPVPPPRPSAPGPPRDRLQRASPRQRTVWGWRSAGARGSSVVRGWGFGGLGLGQWPPPMPIGPPTAPVGNGRAQTKPPNPWMSYSTASPPHQDRENSLSGGGAQQKALGGQRAWR